MTSNREIRTQITSIKNTQKITKAMQLVAASKIRRAEERMAASMPYSQKIRLVIGHVAKSHTEYPHPYLQVPEEINRIGFIIISSDRGLCGGLNNNLFRYLTRNVFSEWQIKDIAIDLCLIGTKAEMFFKHEQFRVVAHADHFGDVPLLSDLIGTVKVMLDSYYRKELGGLYIAHNVFVNAMHQYPTVEQLLPLEVSGEIATGYWDYIYEPDAKKLLDTLLRRYIETQVYQAALDNVACEQAARMVAMKNATDNAGELIDDLQLIYNKTRQAAITREISEIIGGAEALK